MRQLSGIVISFTTLLLLVFGAGGLGLTKCACSGRTTLLTLDDVGCCPSEGDCMTVTVVSMPDSDMPDHGLDAPLLDCAAVLVPNFVILSPTFESRIPIPDLVYSPPRFTLTTVLRL